MRGRHLNGTSDYRAFAPLDRMQFRVYNSLGRLVRCLRADGSVKTSEGMRSIAVGSGLCGGLYMLTLCMGDFDKTKIIGTVRFLLSK